VSWLFCFLTKQQNARQNVASTMAVACMTTRIPNPTSRCARGVVNLLDGMAPLKVLQSGLASLFCGVKTEPQRVDSHASKATFCPKLSWPK
jgi:hypothetical protein